MTEIPDDIMAKAREVARGWEGPLVELTETIASALLSERTAQEAEIARLTARAAELDAVLNGVCDIAIGRDVLDGFPRGRDEIQRRLAKIYEITRAALTPTKENDNAE